MPPPLLRKVQVLPGLLFVLTPNTCEIGDGGTIVDRPALQYDCQATIWFPEQTLWIDQELGYVLKMEGGWVGGSGPWPIPAVGSVEHGGLGLP